MRFPNPLRLFGFLVLLSLGTAAQTPAQPREAVVAGGNPLEQHLFPPELVMAHQGEIGLAADQRQKLIEEVQSLQADIVPWQFEMNESVESLTGQLANAAVDEAAAIALAESITNLEARIKQRHLALLIRIKNLLSAEQQSRLRALRQS